MIFKTNLKLMISTKNFNESSGVVKEVTDTVYSLDTKKRRRRRKRKKTDKTESRIKSKNSILKKKLKNQIKAKKKMRTGNTKRFEKLVYFSHGKRRNTKYQELTINQFELMLALDEANGVSAQERFFNTGSTRLFQNRIVPKKT